MPLFFTRLSLSVPRRLKVAASVSRTPSGNKAVKFGNREHVAAFRSGSDRVELAAVHRGADPGCGSEAQVARSFGGGQQPRDRLVLIERLHDGTAAAPPGGIERSRRTRQEQATARPGSLRASRWLGACSSGPVSIDICSVHDGNRGRGCIGASSSPAIHPSRAPSITFRPWLRPSAGSGSDGTVARRKPGASVVRAEASRAPG